MEMVDTLIHVRTDLTTQQRDAMEEELRGYPGMLSVHFSHEHSHLLVVEYDPNAISSAEILKHVGERGAQASRIGL